MNCFIYFILYRIPICKSDLFGRDRPWKVDKPFCVNPQVLLDAGKKTDSEDNRLRLENSIVVFTRLPVRKIRRNDFWNF